MRLANLYPFSNDGIRVRKSFIAFRLWVSCVIFVQVQFFFLYIPCTFIRLWFTPGCGSLQNILYHLLLYMYIVMWLFRIGQLYMSIYKLEEIFPWKWRSLHRRDSLLFCFDGQVICVSLKIYFCKEIQSWKLDTHIVIVVNVHMLNCIKNQANLVVVYTRSSALE